ncbi:MAG: hypothetical protein AAF081_12740 [Actinomycetota bacterium]
MTLTLVHAAATWFLVGLIWTIQVVHYPLFAKVGEAGFVAYEAAHTRLISLIVGPAMLVEGIATLWLFFAPPDGLSRTLPLIAGLVLAVVHLSTITLQVPAHGRLEQGWNPVVADRLVRTNWIRTLGWTTRGVLALLMIDAIA